MDQLVEDIMDEIAYKGIVRKQKSINRLFPDWSDKVAGIADKGGLRLRNTEPDEWFFKIHSGTKSGVWYDVHLRFKNVDELLEKYVKDRRLWVRDKSRVDRSKLAKKMLYGVDMQLSCSCPAQLYWGGDYICSLGKYDAKYGRRELRRPRIRNPRQYGMVCKHLQNLLNVLPWYESTMAKWLDQFYGDRIKALEEEAKEEFGWVKAAAVALAKKRGEPEPEEEEEREEEVGESKIEEEKGAEGKVERLMAKVPQDIKDLCVAGDCGQFAVALTDQLKLQAEKPKIGIVIRDEYDTIPTLEELELDEADILHVVTILNRKMYDVEGEISQEKLQSDYAGGDAIVVVPYEADSATETFIRRNTDYINSVESYKKQLAQAPAKAEGEEEVGESRVVEAKAWTKAIAKQYLTKIEPILRKAGYEGKIVGSVAIEGFSKHDLDIMLVPVRDDFDFEIIYDELGGDFTMDMETYEVKLSGGRIVDFLFGEGGTWEDNRLKERNTFRILSYTPAYGGILKVLSSANRAYEYRGISPFMHDKVRGWMKHNQWGTAWQFLRRLERVDSESSPELVDADAMAECLVMYG